MLAAVNGQLLDSSYIWNNISLFKKLSPHFVDVCGTYCSLFGLSRVISFKFSRHFTVQFADHLIDGFLPGWIMVFAHRNCDVKLSQCNLSHFQESLRDLRIHVRRLGWIEELRLNMHFVHSIWQINSCWLTPQFRSLLSGPEYSGK